MNDDLRPFLLAVVLSATSIGCTSISIDVPAWEVPPPAATAHFTAGRAVADITPPPGIPMGGHSIAGQVARGTWTRLHARAFFFRDSAGRSAAFVSCELFAIPAGLRAAVAQRVAQQGVSLAPEELVLAATHTHHGPGNYLSSAVYNGFASPWAGFHEPLFRFLTERIATAVVESARDAGAHVELGHEIVLHQVVTRDLTRNRAVDAFLLDPEAASLPADRECVRYRAIDPELLVLEVVRGVDAGRRTIALLVFFAIHPTALGHDGPLFGSDLTGYAMTLLERRAPAAAPLVAGFFNGAEGDVSPRWIRQDRTDVIRAGEGLAEAVGHALTSEGDREADPEVSSRGASFRAIPAGGPTAGLALPEFGVAAIGGAEDGRTVLEHFGWHGGVRGPARPGQGVKVPALDLPAIPLLAWLKPTRLLAPPADFPSDIPLSLVRLGRTLAVGAIPFEMTTTMGARLRRRLSAAESPRTFVLVGLANEYLSYVTTPEEYDAQEYEGASTIFGPRSGPVVVDLLESLASGPSTARSRHVAAKRFRAGPPPLIPFGESFGTDPHASLDDGLDLLMPDATGRASCVVPRFLWAEEPVDPWSAPRRHVTVLEELNGEWVPRRDSEGVDDDDGLHILTLLADETARPRRWAAFWLASPDADPGKRYRFRVETAGLTRVCSTPFNIGAPAEPGGVPAAERCP
jgi:neutral ceramidase